MVLVLVLGMVLICLKVVSVLLGGGLDGLVE